MKNDEERGARIRKAMNERGIKVPALAQRLGVSQQAVRQWLAGIADPSKRYVALARELGVSPEYIAFGTDAGVAPAAARRDLVSEITRLLDTLTVQELEIARDTLRDLVRMASVKR